MAHTLPALPYASDALDPHIDPQTMEIHHGKHHQAYVDKLNAAIQGKADLEAMSIEDLLKNISKVPEDIRQGVINNGGGHANHSLFWTVMGPGKGGAPSGALGSAIDSAFGSFDKFQETFTNNALTQFGSGWSWLVWDGTALKAVKKPNQDSPLMDGHVPLVGCDVWEHAYYLKYQNKRPDYVKAWWNTVDWDAVAGRFADAKAGK